MTLEAPAANALEISPEIADAAIGDQRDARAFQGLRHIRNRGDLRHADTGHDARGADRTGTDADLDCVGARIRPAPRGGAGGDIAADHVDMRIVLLDPADAVDHAWRMAVGGIDHQHVDTGMTSRFDALVGIFADAYRSADAQLALAVLGRQTDARSTFGYP